MRETSAMSDLCNIASERRTGIVDIVESCNLIAKAITFRPGRTPRASLLLLSWAATDVDR